MSTITNQNLSCRKAIDLVQASSDAVAKAEISQKEAANAINHHANMVREFGRTHPVTVQALSFAQELNDQARVLNMLARQVHEGARVEIARITQTSFKGLCNLSKVINALGMHDGKYIDDHVGGEGAMKTAYAVAVHGNEAVLLHNSEPYFCINRMYVDADGIAHLSRSSVGGLLEVKQHGGLENAIAVYNDPSSWVEGWKQTLVENVVYLNN